MVALIIAVASFVGAIGLTVAGWGFSILLDDNSPFLPWVAPALIAAGISLVVITLVGLVVLLVWVRWRDRRQPNQVVDVVPSVPEVGQTHNVLDCTGPPPLNIPLPDKAESLTATLLLYPHNNPPYNAVKMVYVGSEIAKDVEVKVHYTDREGKEQAKLVTEFFPENDPGMWQYHEKYDHLDPGRVGYFSLIQKKSTSDGKATVTIKFQGAKSGTPVSCEREFELRDF